MRTWIGVFAYSHLASVVLLAVGAGAILQVIYEVTRLLLKGSTRSKTPALSVLNLGGFTAGVAIMYATALLVERSCGKSGLDKVSSPRGVHASKFIRGIRSTIADSSGIHRLLVQ